MQFDTDADSSIIRYQRRTLQHLSNNNSTKHMENDQFKDLILLFIALNNLQYISSDLIDRCSPEMIHILLRSNVDILDYIIPEILSIDTWFIAVQHNIWNILLVPSGLRLNLALHLVITKYYSLYEFQGFITYSFNNILISFGFLFIILLFVYYVLLLNFGFVYCV
jgi:hypothetical protein